MLTTTFDRVDAPVAAPPRPAIATRQLVCEGRCNPHAPSVSAWVDQERTRLAAVTEWGRLIPLEGEVLLALHSLRHTEHEHVGGDLWVCRSCGQPRRFGLAF